MNLFFTKRGKLENWYKQKIKKLNDDYFTYVAGRSGKANIVGETAMQRANRRNTELAQAKEAVKQEYLQRLNAMGQQPKADFS